MPNEVPLWPGQKTNFPENIRGAVIFAVKSGATHHVLVRTSVRSPFSQTPIATPQIQYSSPHVPVPSCFPYRPAAGVFVE
jgi:hypothetical protein